VTITQARHYQIEGIDWLTQPNVLASLTDLLPILSRHILTDAPGSGKTYQSSEAARLLLTPNQACLVAAPAHLCKQWFEYLCEQYPDDNVVWLEGTRPQKLRDSQIAARWYILSIQSLRQHEFMDDLVSAMIIQHHISVCIIDESHYVKNRDAVQSKVLRKLTRPDFVPHVILLTATPIMKEADDLYMQLRICDPISFASFDRFLNQYCWFSYTSWGPQDISLKRGAVEALAQWMMGRTYAQIGLELPPLIAPPPVVHNLGTDRRKAYDDLKNYWYTVVTDESESGTIDANSAMELMHLLRRVTDGPDKQADITTYLSDDPTPTLIATSYRASARNLLAAITKAHPTLRVTVITGEVPATERAAKAKAPADVVIATIPSLSEGCDLSHMNTVYFYEEDWAPGKHHQFLSRVRRHRDNSTGAVVIDTDNHLHVDEDPNDKPVLVRYFHADRTIDQRIHAVRDHRAVNVKDLIKVELGL
jgi:superfamily II DNA or RNA helicase